MINIVQFVHCADLHLDKTFAYSSFQSVQKRKRDLQERFMEVVSFALKERVDLFLISGDVFDKIAPTNDARNFFAEQIRTLKEKNIYPILIGGNHDVPKYQQEKPMAIDILDTVKIATVFKSRTKFDFKKYKIEGKTVVVYGKSFDPMRERQNPLTDLKITEHGAFNLLLFHGSFLGKGIKSTIPEKVNYHPFNESDVKRYDVDYIALGHYHNYYTIQIEDGPLVANPGSLERFTFLEKKEKKGFIFGELEETGVSTQFIEVNARSVADKIIILDTSIENLNELIESKISSIENPEMILRIRLKGKISLSQLNQLDLRQIIRNTSDKFFSLEIDRTELELEELGKIFITKIERPKEAFVKTLDSKIQAVTKKEEQSFLEKVKRKGLSYFQQLEG